MKATNNHSLVFSGMAVLTFAAQLIFLAPFIQPDKPIHLPWLLVDITGIIFYAQGIVLIASWLFSYQQNTQARLNIITAILFVLIGWAFVHMEMYVEAVGLFFLAAGFPFSNWFHPKRAWLVIIMQWANLFIGVGLCLYPNVFFTTGPRIIPAGTALMLGIIFIFSAMASLMMGIFPAFYRGKAGRFLALPWFLWALSYTVQFSIANLGIAVSLGLSLALNEFVPWQKVIMQQAVDIGRRFFRLIVFGQVVSLAVIVWQVHFVEATLNVPAEISASLREVMIISYNLLAGVGVLMVTWINLTINGTFSGLSGSLSSTAGPFSESVNENLWKRFSKRLFEPFETSQNYIGGVVDARKEYASLLAKQLAAEKRRVAQLSLLHEMNLKLEPILDPSVSAQITATAIQHFMDAALVAIFETDRERGEIALLASSGPQRENISTGYRQSIHIGMAGRAIRLRNTQFSPDTRLDEDYISIIEPHALSEIAVPVMYNNRLRGMIVVDHREANAFDESDIRTIETVAIQLMTSWVRKEHDLRLTSLINAGITLSTTLALEGLIQEIAETAQKTLDAQFVFTALLDQGRGFSRSAYCGYAPALLNLLNHSPNENELVQNVINSPGAFRSSDIGQSYTDSMTIKSELRSLLAVPVRIRQSSIGAILAFGKQDSSTFTENDQALISLLATQAAAAIETTWLYQELREMLTTATRLYQLSTKVIQSEQLADAAGAIAETAFQLSNGQVAGIVLFSQEKNLEVKMQIDKSGLHPGTRHPMELINQSIESGQMIIHSGKENSVRICLPLQTPRRQYGALWVDMLEDQYNGNHFSDNIQALTNQAAIALERGLLLVETRRQAVQIEAAYRELEITYDQTLVALSSALDARDRETEGHSLRVARIACQLSKRIGLSPEQAKIMERGAILHDIGKIGISDSVLLKPGPLTPEEWQAMRLHPDIGARIIEGIPFLKDALPVIRYHQERWDGSGYPMGLKGQDIPLMARMFSVVDAFDALTSNRPYRQPISTQEAVEYLCEQSDILFDPEIVQEFKKMADEGVIDSLR